MAESREEFEERLAALGSLVSAQRVISVTTGSLRAVKEALDDEAAAAFAALLPGWMREDWKRLPQASFRGAADDLVDILKEQGGYPYRAAAERDLTAFFATLRESLPEGGALEMRPLLPEANRELFDYAASCAYDASVREFV
ncbi:MAG: DUF2267 domain-containing protein [Actinobacteria bacterium]|jgi:uncharacterized protein (DUF2267 family)|nr:MAG: DUF2267 domain-containing protein [Actinomycetota bacterium]